MKLVERILGGVSTVQNPKSIESIVSEELSTTHGFPDKVAEELAKKNNPRVTKVLLEFLTSPDKLLVARALTVLRHIKDKTTVDPILACLNDEYSLVRREATYALGWIKDPKAIDPLIKGLTDDYFEVRSLSARALGWILFQYRENVEPLVVKKVLSALDKARDVRSCEDPRVLSAIDGAIESIQKYCT